MVHIYIEVENREYYSYDAPVIPRVGEIIVFEKDFNEPKEFLVKTVSHYTDTTVYEVTLSCKEIT